MPKCWFWQHRWGEWVKTRIEQWEGVYMRRRRNRTYFERKCLLCEHKQEAYDDEVWWD